MAAVPVGVIGGFVLLLVVTLVAASIGSGFTSPGLPGASPLDYRGRPNGVIAPLDARFIADALGSAAPLPFGDSPESTPQLTQSRGVPTAERRVVDDHPATNDRRAAARPIIEVPFTARTHSRGATRSAEDPNDCTALGGTVWYRFKADEALRLVASTVGTDHAVAVAVFRESAGGLSAVGCDTDLQGSALVAFLAEPGSTYLFQIAAPTGGGDLVFSLDPHGAVRRVSIGAHGEPPDARSHYTSVSGDGRYVAFVSAATNLIAGSGPEDDDCFRRGGEPVPDSVHEGPCAQVWLRDMHSGDAELVSVSDSGVPANSNAYWPAVSADGRFVAFATAATNLGKGSDQLGVEIFVRDRHERVTDRVPLPPVPLTPDALEHDWLMVPAVSDDGRFVVFQTGRAVVPDDSNGVFDVYVFDRTARSFQRVSVSSSGEQAAPTDQSTMYGTRRTAQPALVPSISGDGRWIAFRSNAPNLVPVDTNQTWDTFIHDRLTRHTERVSLSSSGAQAEGQSLFNRPSGATISADGRFVVFVSEADNLAPGDQNGIPDVFVRDRGEGTTFRLSGAWDAPSMKDQLISWPTISRDGRYVAWDSNLAQSNAGCMPGALSGGACERTSDVYRHDRTTDSVLPLTVPGGQGDSFGWMAALSGDGMHVGFLSTADDLAGPNDGRMNVFLFAVGALR